MQCNYEWKVIPNDFLHKNSRCPRCQGRERYTDEDFGKIVDEITNGEYCLKGKYINNRVSVEIKHLSCNVIFNVLPPAFLYGEQRCPICTNAKSKAEVKIFDYLTANNIKFKDEYTFDDCRNINCLPFDFAILGERNNVFSLIEFDGKQHYEPIEFFGGEEVFKLTQIRDQIKNEYCIKNSIPLLRIPYWEEKNINEILEIYLNKIIYHPH